MTIETAEDLEKLRVIGKIVATCLQHMASMMEPGMTTGELDAIGARFLDAHGARSAPQLTYDFPGATCISVNEEVAHGIPGARVLQVGDLVNIDVSAAKDGFFGDTGGSFPVGPGTERQLAVCKATKSALHKAMRKATAGGALNQLGLTIQQVAKKSGLKIVRNLGSHGVGAALHEEPGFIAPFYDPRDKRRMWKGLVITIEPFLTTGPTHVSEGDDGWTLLSTPGSITAQYEHTLVITDGQPLVMTSAA